MTQEFAPQPHRLRMEGTPAFTAGVGYVAVYGIRRDQPGDLMRAYDAVSPFGRPYYHPATGTMDVAHRLSGTQYHDALVAGLHLDR